jgi:nucleoside-diphosphate-sugar epimerase
MKKIILITGGSGFLGINLIRHLLKNGFTNLKSLDLEDFDYPEKNKVNVTKGDIRDVKTVEKIMEGVSYVIHAAAALPLYSKKEIYSTDIDGTKNLLEAALNKKVEKFIHISSTAVYGIPEHHPIDENDKLVGVGSYGRAKIRAEELCNEYRKRGMCVSILRPKSFVGPERLGVFALLYDWASDAKNFPMIGYGHNRYQLLDVEDLCSAIFQVIKLEKIIVNDTFNIGAKKFTTMKEDYQAVLNEAGYGKKIIGFPATPVIYVLRILEFFKISPLYKWVYETASKDSYVSIKKAENILIYIPKYSNKEALIRNYKWYLKNRETFKELSGVSHRVPWKQGILKLFKLFF